MEKFVGRIASKMRNPSRVEHIQRTLLNGDNPEHRMGSPSISRQYVNRLSRWKPEFTYPTYMEHLQGMDNDVADAEPQSRGFPCNICISWRTGRYGILSRKMRKVH